MQQTIQVRCKPQHRNGCPNWKLKINPRTIGMIVLTPCDYEQSIMKKCLNQYQLNTNAFRRIRCIPRGAKDTAPTTQSGHRCCNVTKPRACRLTKIEINVMLQNGTQNIWIAHANKRTSFSSLQHAGLKFFEFIIDNSY